MRACRNDTAWVRCFFQDCNFQPEATGCLGQTLNRQKAKFFYFMVKGAQPYPEGMGSLFFGGKILQVATNDFLSASSMVTPTGNLISLAFTPE